MTSCSVSVFECEWGTTPRNFAATAISGTVGEDGSSDRPVGGCRYSCPSQYAQPMAVRFAQDVELVLLSPVLLRPGLRGRGDANDCDDLLSERAARREADAPPRG
jgi:hypothetical protein